jgi:Fic family protein
MLIPPKYNLDNEIIELLNCIEASREVIETIKLPSEIELNIRRQSTLRSSLFSARIEGNELTLDELTNTSNIQKKAEVFNTLKAFNYINKRSKKDLSLNELKEIHKITMQGLNAQAGEFRHEMSATFNAAGIAVYMHPAPREIESKMTRLLKFINSEKEKFVPIRAALAHYTFEKIHPFLDGNGRVGRLIMQKVMMQGGYGMKGLVAYEEYIDENRSEYYRALEEPEKDSTDYVKFILTAMAETAIKTKKLVVAKQKFEKEDFLLPRRAEIYKIISEQNFVNFDMIKRRFGKVNPRTLRYDLKKLQDGGFITKLGSTRGVYYKKIN